MQKLIQFLKEVLAEFKNITWPQKDTLVQLTFAIVAVSVIISAFLGGLDYAFTNTIGVLSNSVAPNTIQVDPSQVEMIPEVTPIVSPEVTTLPTQK
jgi:preprotein translocase SecE subunit